MYKIKHTDDCGKSMWVSQVDDTNNIVSGKESYDFAPSFPALKAFKIEYKNKNCELVETSQNTKGSRYVSF